MGTGCGFAVHSAEARVDPPFRICFDQVHGYILEGVISANPTEWIRLKYRGAKIRRQQKQQS